MFEYYDDRDIGRMSDALHDVMVLVSGTATRVILFNAGETLALTPYVMALGTQIPWKPRFKVRFPGFIAPLGVTALGESRPTDMPVSRC